MPLIQMQNVSKWYGSFAVLTDCSTNIEQGEVVVVCGPSGSGKSTLIKTINGLEPFQSGTIMVDGISVGNPKTSLNALRSQVGMVFQNFELFPHLSVTENLILAQIKVLKKERSIAIEQGLKYLNRVGLIEHKDKFPGQLSGGQQQRVAIARALVNQPRIILADEPTGNLDSKTSEEIMDLFNALNKEGITIIIVTHENDIAEHASRQIRFLDGKIVEDHRNKKEKAEA